MDAIRKFVLGLAILTALVFITSWLFRVPKSLESDDFLSVVGVIVQVQATLFAIVFGFTVLAIEGASGYFTPEAVTIYLRSRGILWVVVVYLSSIVFGILCGLWQIDSHIQMPLLLLNILMIPIGVLSLTGYMAGVIKGIVPNEVLDKLANQVTTEELVDFLREEVSAGHDWLYQLSPGFFPLRSLIDIAVKATVERNRLLATDTLNVLIHLAETTCPDRKPDQLDVRSYYGCLFLEARSAGAEHNDQNVAMQATRGLATSLEYSLFGQRRCLWEEICSIFEDAARRNWVLECEEIARLLEAQFTIQNAPDIATDAKLYEDVILVEPVRTKREIGIPADGEVFASSDPQALVFYLERIAQAILGKPQFHDAFVSVIASLLYTATSSVMHQGKGGAAADALVAFRRLVLGTHELEDKLGDLYIPIVQSCMDPAYSCFEFAAAQPYRSGYTLHDRWWASFPSWYLVDQTLRPLGSHFFKSRWGNIVLPLSQTSGNVATAIILGTARLGSGHKAYAIERIVDMFSEWYRADSNNVFGGRVGPNGDLVIKAIISSALRIANSDGDTLNEYLVTLQEAFSDTGAWASIFDRITSSLEHPTAP